MKSFQEYLSEAEIWAHSPRTGDGFAINIREETLIETVVHSTRDDAVILAADSGMIRILESYHMLAESVSVEEVELRDGSVVDVKVEYDLDADSYDIESAVDVESGQDVTGALTRQGRLRILDAIGDHIAAEREQSRGDGSELAAYQDIQRQLGEGAMSEIDMDLRHIGKTESFDALQDALAGKFGTSTKHWLEDRMIDIGRDYRLHYDDDIDQIMEILMDQLVEQYGDDLDEAKYQGREVPLGKPMQGDVKKKKVYVRKPNGNIVKVNFGDPKMRIKKSNPKRRKSFRARHNCKNPGPRWKARFWSCRAW
jgi:hypothetical protein